MIVFLKAQLSSLVATAVDFGVTIFFVELLGVGYVTAAVNGAVAGAITNFLINKFWSFKRGNKRTAAQGIRYGLVWLGSISLNVGGSNLLITVFKMPYLLSKIITSVIIGITFNYTLQKHYVFGNVKKTNNE